SAGFPVLHWKANRLPQIVEMFTHVIPCLKCIAQAPAICVHSTPPGSKNES
ncbi:MAG: hypothetical protein ACI9LO_003343, partial [Planctomycetota bacterium]